MKGRLVTNPFKTTHQLIGSTHMRALDPHKNIILRLKEIHTITKLRQWTLIRIFLILTVSLLRKTIFRNI